MLDLLRYATDSACHDRKARGHCLLNYHRCRLLVGRQHQRLGTHKLLEQRGLVEQACEFYAP